MNSISLLLLDWIVFILQCSEDKFLVYIITDIFFSTISRFYFRNIWHCWTLSRCAEISQCFSRRRASYPPFICVSCWYFLSSIVPGTSGLSHRCVCVCVWAELSECISVCGMVSASVRLVAVMLAFSAETEIAVAVAPCSFSADAVMLRQVV